MRIHLNGLHVLAAAAPIAAAISGYAWFICWPIFLVLLGAASTSTKFMDDLEAAASQAFKADDHDDEVYLLSLDLKKAKCLADFHRRGAIIWGLAAAIGWVLLLTYPAWGCKP